MTSLFNGIGGNPYNLNVNGFGSVPIQTAPTTTLYNNYNRLRGDTLEKVNGYESALKYDRLDPGSRAVLFDANEDIFYIVTSDASRTNSVQAFSFAPLKRKSASEEQYVTIEEFNKFKEDSKCH